MDMAVWLSEELSVTDLLEPDGWERDTGFCSLVTRSYRLAANEPIKMVPEDVPDEVTDLVPGVAWMVDLSLEGDNASGERRLNRAATLIARAGHGVIEDNGVFRTPSGVRRYQKPPTTEQMSVVAMSWFAPGGPMLTKEGVEHLLSVLQRLLSEAVPVRWGIDQRPNHSFDQEGVEGIVAFIDAHRARNHGPLVRVKRPCTALDIDFSSEWGRFQTRPNRPSSFKVTHLRLDVDASVLHQSGWRRHLSRLFQELTEVIEPFYAEARILQVATGRSGYFVRGTEWHPVSSNSWQGFPNTAPMAFALGQPYLDVWHPENGTVEGKFLFVSGEELWRADRIVDPWDPPFGSLQDRDHVPEPRIGGGSFLPSPTGEPPAVWPFEMSH